MQRAKLYFVACLHQINELLSLSLSQRVCEGKKHDGALFMFSHLFLSQPDFPLPSLKDLLVLAGEADLPVVSLTRW